MHNSLSLEWPRFQVSLRSAPAWCHDVQFNRCRLSTEHDFEPLSQPVLRQHTRPAAYSISLCYSIVRLATHVRTNSHCGGRGLMYLFDRIIRSSSCLFSSH